MRRIYKQSRQSFHAPSLILMLVVVLTAIFSAVPTRPVEAAKELNNWVTTKGSINPATELPFGRFVFETPFQIKDTVTGDIYVTSGREDGKAVFNNGTKETMRRNGWFWYYPQKEGSPIEHPTVNGAVDESRCTGAIVWRGKNFDGPISNESREQSVAGIEMYLAQARKTTSGNRECDFLMDNDDGDPDNEYEYEITGRMNISMSLAMMRWDNKNKLEIYDAGRSIGPIDSGTKLDKIKADLGDSFIENNTLYSRTQCAGEDGENDIVNAFLAVPKTGTSKAIGTLYYHQDGGWREDWDGGEFNCLFGRNLTTNQSHLAGDGAPGEGDGKIYLALSNKAGEDGPAGGDNEGDAQDGAEDDGCNVELYSPLSWILCPAIQLLEEATNSFYSAAISALHINIDPTSGGGQALEGAWSNIRNIANVLFIIALLSIIISQAMKGKW